MTLASELTRYMAQARMRLPGALDAAIYQETFAVLDELFKTSMCWREIISFAVTTTDWSHTIASAVSSAALYRLISVEDGNGTTVETTRSIGATMEVPGTIVLNNLPPIADTFYATVGLTIDEPVDSDTGPIVPAWVFEQYRQGILDGLLGHMMSQPAKPYSNERMAVYHSRRFRGMISRARVDAMHKNLHGGQAWRFPTSFSVRANNGT
jgi:hypothetical protein